MRLRHALRVRLVRALEQAVETATTRVLAEDRAGTRDDLRREIVELRRQVEALQNFLRDREIRDRRDMIAAGERDAVVSSARFVREAMRGARTFPRPAATLEHALRVAPCGGMALEFGVYSGTVSYTHLTLPTKA